MNLNHVRVFVTVARCGGFAAAGRQLDLPTSTVSRNVSQLERSLGLRLLDRGPRHLRITSAGHRLLRSAGDWIDESEQLAEALRDEHAGLSGSLRVRWPGEAGQRLLSVPVLRFAREHPRLRLGLSVSDATGVSPGDEFDLAFLFQRGRARASDLVVKVLARLQSVVVAAPSLLASRPAPRLVEQLAAYPCVSSASALEGRPWVFAGERGEGEVLVEVDAVFRVDGADLARRAALDGLGAAMLPLDVCRDDLAQGRLQALALGRAPAPLEVTAVYPHRRIPRKARALTEAVQAHLSAIGFAPA